MQTVITNVQQKENNREVVLSLFLVGIFMGALDHGIVGPALSSITAVYKIETSWGVWSFSIYTLLFASSIPIMAKMSDRVGRKQIFMVGIILFGLGSLVCVIATNYILFLIGRCIQAVGTGGIFPITAAYIAVSYPDEKRAKMLGLIGTIFGLGTIVGPLAGGLVIKYFQWQWVFLINVPISVLVVLFMGRIRITQNIVKKTIDFAGMLLLTAIILIIMLGITLKNVWLIAVGAIIIPFFIRIEKKSADPIMNISYFKSKNTFTVLIVSLFSGFIMASTINLLPAFLETSFGWAKGDSGFGTAPLAVSSMIASLAGGYLVTRLGAKKVLYTGFILTLIGTVSFPFIQNIVFFLLMVTLAGFGIGIIIGAPLNILMIQSVALAETGSAVGYVSLFRSIGSTLGPTVAGILIAFSTKGFFLVYILLGIVSIISMLLLLIKTVKK